MMEESNSSSGSRRVLVIRHGERMDFTFGNSWIKEVYERTDLNMPESLPKREVKHWEKDTPLTKMGEYQASLIGLSLKDSGISFNHVFVSPAYRCLQTATNILRAIGSEAELALNIEYGLFEWIGFYKDNMPQWFSEREAGKLFNINEDYQPFVTRVEYESSNSESLEEIYDFNSRVSKEILKKYKGNILIVAHGANLETCTRELMGKTKRSWADLRVLLAKVPYVGAMAMEQSNDLSYKLIEPPCLRLTHDATQKFDWKTFDDDYSEESKKANESQNKATTDYLSKMN